MRIPDDDRQFEAELKRFAAREVASLPAASPVRSRWRASLALAAVIMVMVGVFLYLRERRGYSPVPQHEVRLGNVTLGGAGLKLNRAASFEEAIDELDRNSRPQKQRQIEHRQSALAVLGREEL